MKKILIIGLSDKIGGIETLFYGLFKQKTDCFDLSFLYFSPHGAYEDEYKNNRYNIYHLGSRKQNFLKFNNLVADFFKKYNDFDYVWVNTSSTSIYQFQYYAKKYTNARVITHSHGTSFDSSSGKLLYFMNKVLGKVNYKRVIDNTDLFFCCSYAAGIALFGKKKQSELIMIKNGVSEERFAFSENKRDFFRTRFGIDKKKIVIGFVGRLSKQKNPIRAIEVFGEYHRIHENSILVIAGDGKLMASVKAKVEELGIKDDVKILGFFENVDYLYCGIDLLLMPSLFEGLPLGGIEAQMTGLPCLFSDSITKELEVTELADFLALSEKDEVWAKRIDDLIKKSTGIKREEYCCKVVEAGYCYSETLQQIERMLK